MELTLDSALTPSGMVGHASYLLLVLAMLMRSMTTLRFFVIASACAAIAHNMIWQENNVGVFWTSLLLGVCILQFLRDWINEHSAQFNPEELAFVRSRLRGLNRAEARRLLDMGTWADVGPGVVLTREGQPVESVSYLVDGEVDIAVGGQVIGTCRPGNFVGEMSVLGRRPASATAIVKRPSRYWRIASDILDDLQKTEPTMASAFQAGIARDLRNKIIAGNQAAFATR